MEVVAFCHRVRDPHQASDKTEQEYEACRMNLKEGWGFSLRTGTFITRRPYNFVEVLSPTPVAEGDSHFC